MKVNMVKKWRVLSKNNVFESKWFSVTENSAIMPNGIPIENYYVVENQDAVMIAAIDDKSNIILKREFRLPVNEVLLELPAGAIEKKDRNCLEAAKRELYEETGYVCEKWVYLGKTFDCPDRCTGALHLFLAHDAQKKSSQHLDMTENIEVVTMSLKEAEEMCLNNSLLVNSCARLILTASRICFDD